jgi:hypothetical protein
MKVKENDSVVAPRQSIVIQRINTREIEYFFNLDSSASVFFSSKLRTNSYYLVFL